MQAGDLQARAPDLGLGFGLALLLLADRAGQLAADHRGDQAIVIELRHGSGHDPVPVAEHGHAVADLVDLLQVVRDVEDRDAARLDPADAVEQPLDRMRLERRGRLVEDQEPRPNGKGPGDLDDLLLLDRELGGGLVDVEVEAPLEQELPGSAAQRAPADQAALRPVQEDVLADAQRGDDHRALVDARDAFLPRGSVAEAGRGVAVETDGATVGLEQPGQDRYERRLPGAVSPHERVALAGEDGDGDVLERPRPAEGLPDRLRLRGRRLDFVRPPTFRSQRGAHYFL